ncbi:ABC transporter substrate-binding protein [Sinorhizobium meliloti]|uniref:ABC transporter substrate-binding protein n=1 Tax=Rhizobium meliloti TaxID=382 RepID=UPI00398D5AB9
MSFNPSHPSISRLKAAALVAGTVIFLATAQPIFAEEQLVIATTGGTWEKQMREYFFDPFTAQTGIEIVTVSSATSDTVARIKAMQAGGDVQWDLYQAGEIQAASEQHQSLNEDMTEFCKPYAENTDLLPGACKPSGVLSAYGTTLLAYNDNVFAETKPKTWRDFFDVDRFPGPRAMPNFNDPWRVLAAALLADGVVPDKLFPLDLDRAFAKLTTLRPHVGLWWKSGDQSTQGFRNGEYVIGEIWQTRAAALKAEGQPIEWSQEQAFLVGDRWALIKGTRNRENALKFLRYFLANTDAQAKRCEEATCTPVTYSAAAKMSAEARSALPTSPDVLKTLIVPDADWINAHSSEMLERWNMWLQQ